MRGTDRSRPLGALGLAGALALAACAGPAGTAVRAGVGEAAEAGPHCYRTLAEVDCLAAPQPGEARRRVGWFDAPARD